MSTETTTSTRHVWRIDDLPDIEKLSVSDAFRLWRLLDAEFSYRLELDESKESALGAQYHPVKDRIERAIADTDAIDGMEIAFKIDLFEKLCDGSIPGEGDWAILHAVRLSRPAQA